MFRWLLIYKLWLRDGEYMRRRVAGKTIGRTSPDWDVMQTNQSNRVPSTQAVSANSACSVCICIWAAKHQQKHVLLILALFFAISSISRPLTMSENVIPSWEVDCDICNFDLQWAGFFTVWSVDVALKIENSRAYARNASVFEMQFALSSCAKTGCRNGNDFLTQITINWLQNARCVWHDT